MLIGEPYWRRTPPDEETARACNAAGIDDFLSLPELIGQFQGLGYDVVEMVLADQDSWDRYAAAQWLNLRRWLDRNPDDELAPEVRKELDAEPARYARATREYLGWGGLRPDGALIPASRAGPGRHTGRAPHGACPPHPCPPPARRSP
ncbi:MULTISPECIES: hypothetical protein [Nocardiopsidaceae]|uniref:Uncharacterized protein n=1 Tax=Streptomonospora nanhaiensis TaxID=1323731 RepID=A0ABY6YFE0_9ACTN|nr:hypothetical protein [Streptomonospora nanhaiensis]WAE70955.1 hypothetical protein OUQ99_17095 [Streptomonospora nanhaiensis]